MSLAPANPEARREADAYPTPYWVTRRLMGALRPLLPAAPIITDPCAGRGHILRVLSEPKWGFTVESCLYAWELSEDVPPDCERWCDSWTGGIDSLSLEWPGCDAEIMNPPFSLAAQFVQKALAAAPVVAVLQRMNWLAEIVDAAGGRVPSVLMIPDRISFVHKCFYGPGKRDYTLVPFDQSCPPGTILNARGRPKRVVASDATTYAWYVFEPSNAARVVVLPRTSLAERQEGMWKDQVAA